MANVKVFADRQKKNMSPIFWYWSIKNSTSHIKILVSRTTRPEKFDLHATFEMQIQDYLIHDQRGLDGVTIGKLIFACVVLDFFFIWYKLSLGKGNSSGSNRGPCRLQRGDHHKVGFIRKSYVLRTTGPKRLRFMWNFPDIGQIQVFSIHGPSGLDGATIGKTIFTRVTSWKFIFSRTT
jgi:hypothetical protein